MLAPRSPGPPRRAGSSLSAGAMRRLRQVFVAAVVSPLLILLLLGATVGGVTFQSLGTADQGGLADPSEAAKAEIPPAYLELYRKAGAEYGLQWEYIAAIGKIETNHGRLDAPGVSSGTNSHGCCAGPMQFCVIDGCPNVGPQSLGVAQAQAGTWRAYAVDGDGDGRKNPWSAADAIPAAANMLKRAGAPGNWHDAIFSYNHAEWYVDDVMAQAAAYRAAEVIVNALPGSSPSKVVNHPRIDFGPETAQHEADVLGGRIDPRLLNVMLWIAAKHSFIVTSLRVDHDADGGNHPAGRAMDIGSVDGQICNGARNNACGDLAVELASIRGKMRSTELIYCFDPDGDNLRPDEAWAQSDHCDHIHFGYDG